MVSDKIVRDKTSFKSPHLVMHVKHERSLILLFYVDLSLHYGFFIFTP